MVKQTAGRDALHDFAPKFAELNDDVLFGEVWSREGQLPLRLLLQIGRSSLSFELPLSFEQAAAYRKANGQYVRKNQWRDTTVRVFIDLD